MIWICVDRENDSLCEYTENKIVLLFYKIKKLFIWAFECYLMIDDDRYFVIFGLESNRIFV